MFSFLQPANQADSTVQWPDWLTQLQQLGWHDWLPLPLALVLAWVLARAIGKPLHAALHRLAQRSASKFDNLIVNHIRQPLEILLIGGLLKGSMAVIPYPVETTVLLGHTVLVLLTVGGALLLFKLIDAWTEHKTQQLRSRGQRAKANIMPMVRRALKIFLSLVFIVSLLQNLGVNVGALIAGLGIGGIAIALAGQKTVENLFSGIELILDQPVKVGDFCKAGDLLGTVEDIGLRSTRIRTLERTLVAIPNADFAKLQLENYAKRESIRLLTTLGLRYETSPDQLRWITIEIKKILLAHPLVEHEPMRVRFANFGAFSLDIELLCYIKTTDMNEYSAIREDIYLRVMEVVSASGSGFAFPSQTLYLGKDDGLDDTATKRTEKAVQTARKDHALLSPAFPDDVKDSLAGTLDWPPKGSVVAPLEKELTHKNKKS